MSGAIKIVAFSGSNREGSFNQQVLRLAAEGALSAGAEVNLINLKEYPMPIFDQDYEQNEGTPESVTRLKEIFKESHGLLIASPEYNGSFTPLLKNTIDWLSRSAAGEAPLAAFSGKTAAIMSASPGGLGGLRGLVHLRAVLSGINVLVLPQQVAIPAASDAFGEDGSLKDEKRNQSVLELGRAVTETARRLSRN